MTKPSAMHAHDYRDLIGGGLLFLVGLAVGLYAVSSMDVGDTRRMGPGTLPAIVGFLLAALGAAIAIPAWSRETTFPAINWRASVFLVLGVLSFSASIESLGMVPAIFLLTTFALRASGRVNALTTCATALALCALAYLLFNVGLGIGLAPFRWPF